MAWPKGPSPATRQLLPKIRELAAQGLTDKQIGIITRKSEGRVRALRKYYRIPSQVPEAERVRLLRKGIRRRQSLSELPAFGGARRHEAEARRVLREHGWPTTMIRAEVLAALELGYDTTPRIAAFLEITMFRVRHKLSRLASAGLVVRLGTTRGERWQRRYTLSRELIEFRERWHKEWERGDRG